MHTKPTLTVTSDNILLCPECSEPMVGDGEICETLVGYFSPPGHQHNDNCLFMFYKCKQGHEVKVSIQRRCPSCDWKGKTECFCHKYVKLTEWPDIPPGF